MSEHHDHFKGKSPLQHVAEKRVKGILASAEAHGTELPDHFACFGEALKDTAFLFAIAATIFTSLSIDKLSALSFLVLMGISWSIWRGARSAILSWGHLERLNRIIVEEKFEIENNRDHEREELKVIYEAKGFSGQLLEEVLDVLMADDDRLLRVMLEEELGLTLASQEHPLKQGFYSTLGAALAVFACTAGFYLMASIGSITLGAVCITTSSWVFANFLKNKLLPSLVWNLGLYILVTSSTYYLTDYFF